MHKCLLRIYIFLSWINIQESGISDCCRCWESSSSLFGKRTLATQRPVVAIGITQEKYLSVSVLITQPPIWRALSWVSSWLCWTLYGPMNKAHSVCFLKLGCLLNELNISISSLRDWPNCDSLLYGTWVCKQSWSGTLTMLIALNWWCHMVHYHRIFIYDNLKRKKLYSVMKNDTDRWRITVLPLFNDIN